MNTDFHIEQAYFCANILCVICHILYIDRYTHFDIQCGQTECFHGWICKCDSFFIIVFFVHAEYWTEVYKCSPFKNVFWPHIIFLWKSMYMYIVLYKLIWHTKTWFADSWIKLYNSSNILSNWICIQQLCIVTVLFIHKVGDNIMR
jgi:hypothetical protein